MLYLLSMTKIVRVLDSSIYRAVRVSIHYFMGAIEAHLTFNAIEALKVLDALGCLF